VNLLPATAGNTLTINNPGLTDLTVESPCLLQIGSGLTLISSYRLQNDGSISGSGSLRISEKVGGSGDYWLSVVFGGTSPCKLLTNMTIIGNVTVDTLKTLEEYGADVLSVQGTLTNKGTIRNYEGSLTINVNGSIVNNGTWENTATNLTGIGTMSATLPLNTTLTLSSAAKITLLTSVETNSPVTIESNAELIVGAAMTWTCNSSFTLYGKVSGTNDSTSVLAMGSGRDFATPDTGDGGAISQLKVRVGGGLVSFSGVCNLQSGASFEIDNNATMKLADDFTVVGGTIQLTWGYLNTYGRTLTLDGCTLSIAPDGAVVDTHGEAVGVVITKGNTSIEQGGDFYPPLQVYSGTTSAWNVEVGGTVIVPASTRKPSPANEVTGARQTRYSKLRAQRASLPVGLTRFDGPLTVKANAILSISSGKTLVASGNVTVEQFVGDVADIAKGSRIQRLSRSADPNDGAIEGPGNLIFNGPNGTFDNRGWVNASTTFEVNDDAGKTIAGSGGRWRSLTIGSSCNTRITDAQQFTGAPVPFTVHGTVSIDSRVYLTYSGIAIQTVCPLTYQVLEVSNSAGATLPASVDVQSGLYISQGDLYTGANTITLGSAASLNESGGSVIGKITSTRPYDSEVGISANMGLQFHATGTSPTTVTVTRATGTAPTTIPGVTAIKRYFDISPSPNSGLNSNLKFFFKTADLNGTTPSALKLYKSTDAGTSWTIQSGTTVNLGDSTLNLTGIDSFSRWAAGHSTSTPPTLTTVSPQSGDQGSSLGVTLTGTNFINGASTVSFSGTGVTVNSVTFTSSTQLAANISISSGAATGLRNVSVTTPGGTATKTNAFEVGRPAPVLSSVSPATGGRGQAISVFLNGTGFVNGITSATFGDGITVASVDGSSTSLTAQIVISQSAALGPRDVTVLTPSPGGGESTLTGAFSVVNPVPTITSISPTSGTRGKTLNVVVAGTDFYSGVTSISLGSGITVDSVVVLSNTQLQARLAISYQASGGARDVSVTNASPGGGSATLTGGFTANNPVPKITAVSPVVAPRGKSTTMTITGTDFVTGATSVSAGTGITAGSVTVVSSTQLTVSFSISRSASLGAKDLTVTNGAPGGGTGTLAGAFTVQNPAPTASSVSPQSGILGQSLSVVVTGSDFYSGVTTADFGAGITVNSTTLDTAGTRLTANLTISSTAAVGNRTITLTNSAPGGGSATLANAFVVANPAPTLTSVSPASGGKGQTLNVSIVGTNFIAGVTTVEFGLGITVGSVTVNSPTSLTANISIDANTITAARSVSVTNASPGGGKATLASVFNVENLAPTIASVSPATGSRGETVTVTLTGTSFSSGSTTVAFGSGITVGSVAVVSPTQLTANLTIATGAALGARNIGVTNPPPGGGTATLTNGFMVGNPAPTVSAVAPASGSRGQSLTVNVTGTGFFSGATAVGFGPNIDVTSISVVSPTQLTANITVTAGAATGARSVQVTNPAPGGGTVGLTGGFTVTNPSPTIVGIAPNSVVRGGTVSVTVTGTQFIDGVTSLGLGPDLTQTSFSVRSSTELQANISAASTANAGVRDVSVTNSGPGGGTATLSGGFTVSNPAPTIVSISPTNAGRGSLVNVAITGTQFINGVTTVSFGPDITITNPIVKSASELQISLSIGATAATGARAVSVTNASPGGGTATLAGGFNVTTSPATGIEGELGVIPDQYVLQEAYPNPFNPSTRIRYGIPENSRVELIVHNMLGNVVAELISGERSKGLYELLWHAENLPSGVYLIRFHAESLESGKRFIASRKVVLVK